MGKEKDKVKRKRQDTTKQEHSSSDSSEDFAATLRATSADSHISALDTGDVYSMDHDTYDIVFIIERARRQMDILFLFLFPSLFPTGLAQPDKLCLVYIVEDDGFIEDPCRAYFLALRGGATSGRPYGT